MGARLTDSIPKMIGRYEIRKEIGRGMMGVVYQAHDPDLLRTVALKTISLAFAVSPAEREEFEKRFLAEARAAAALSHPGIVVVHEVGTDAATRTLFMAIEYLRGKTLEQLISQGQPLEWRHALQITARVAEALHHAHAKGIIHRDIKPANIMVLETGPKIMDFGVAKLAAGEATTGGRVFGSPSYMSPEQAIGEPLTARSDLFSLGAVLHELLTGTKAFAGPNLPAILTRVASQHPPAPSQSVPGIPRDVDEVLARMLAKPPAARYPSGMALAEDIEDVLAGRTPRHRKTGTAPQARTRVTKPSTSPRVVTAPPSAGPRVGEGTIRAGAGPSLALPRESVFRSRS
jgi:serine/threonine-protein kinase